jgi:hypothetical protein
MNEAVRILNEIQAEHRVINEQFDTLARAATQLADNQATKQGPRSGEAPSVELGKLQSQLDIIGRTLEAHFTREEAGIADVAKLVGASPEFLDINPLLREHRVLLAAMSALRDTARDTLSGGVQAGVREATEADMQNSIRSFSVKLAQHVKQEGVLFTRLKSRVETG